MKCWEWEKVLNFKKLMLSKQEAKTKHLLLLIVRRFKLSTRIWTIFSCFCFFLLQNLYWWNVQSSDQVLACANCDRDTVIEMSQRLGFLTGMESEVMLEAHVRAGFIVGLPFSREGGYDFHSTNIARSISDLGATMLKHRLTPPPDEAYSLHRKLSGAFLACIKLGAVVPCRELLLHVYEQYHFSDNGVEVLTSSISWYYKIRKNRNSISDLTSSISWYIISILVFQKDVIFFLHWFVHVTNNWGLQFLKHFFDKCTNDYLINILQKKINYRGILFMAL